MTGLVATDMLAVTDVTRTFGSGRTATRALAGSPQVLLADEPTGQLDSETAKQIMRLLRTVVQSEGVTVLVATHDPNLIGIADEVLELEDGKIKDK